MLSDYKSSKIFWNKDIDWLKVAVVEDVNSTIDSIKTSLIITQHNFK